MRHPEEEASKLVLWQPTIGRMNVGRRAITYIDTLMRDTNLASVEELRSVVSILMSKFKGNASLRLV